MQTTRVNIETLHLHTEKNCPSGRRRYKLPWWQMTALNSGHVLWTVFLITCKTRFLMRAVKCILPNYSAGDNVIVGDYENTQCSVVHFSDGHVHFTKRLKPKLSHFFFFSTTQSAHFISFLNYFHFLKSIQGHIKSPGISSSWKLVYW